ncbi:leucine-rich repeat-containing protein 56 [Diorhabda carinulata]|uniref:leucine-rich repeat-containing protein 56 n=1 Tax=Diorhabda carinulata TaxID=1163345 RepID=UPI0025A050AE|nr:leucine-rich repeat-containing protein 56 [Diorhabda carinulata]
MPPNLEAEVEEEDVPESAEQFIINLTPIFHGISSLSSIQDTREHILHINEGISLDNPAQVSLEANLRDLLVQVTNTEDLGTITQLKLRIISRETTLQYLNLYTPALRELTLDGSCVSSLRDLGYGLRNLKILKVNRCGLTCIDGVFGFEQLQELYVADNEITTLAPCAFLNSIKVLDVRRNMISLDDISFIKFCDNIEELYVEGNPGILMNHAFREIIQHRLPQLYILDGFTLTSPVIDNRNALDNGSIRIDENELNTRQLNNNRSHSNEEDRSNFSVEFPPRVFIQ